MPAVILLAEVENWRLRNDLRKDALKLADKNLVYG